MNKLILSPGYVLILPQTTPQATGIIIKKEQEEQFKTGKVVTIGKAIQTWEGTTLTQIEPPCQKDDSVLYTSGYDVLLDNQTYQVARFSNIIGIYV